MKTLLCVLWLLIFNNFIYSQAGRQDNYIGGLYFLSDKIAWTYMGGAIGDIYKTTDGGISWFIQFQSTYSFKAMFVNDSTGFMFRYIPIDYYKGQLLKTTNAGISWQVVNESLHLRQFHFLNEQIGYGLFSINMGEHVYFNFN